jgi:hypothetical protein
VPHSANSIETSAPQAYEPANALVASLLRFGASPRIAPAASGVARPVVTLFFRNASPGNAVFMTFIGPEPALFGVDVEDSVDGHRKHIAMKEPALNDDICGSISP